MHFPSRLWRPLLFLVPALSLTSWASGCVEESAAPSVAPDAAPDDAGPEASEALDASETKRDCANDLDDDGLWRHLECTGLYATFADKSVAPDAKPYKPAFELWSDGAEKHRWVHLPAGSKIDIGDWNEWSYPKGTKLWKEFKLGGRRIETRLFMKLADGSWARTTYRWNADETDAVRKDGGETVDGIGPDGGPYVIPSSGQCDQCHLGRKDQVLGFEAVSLGLPGATGQTLATLAAEGALSQPPPATTLALPGPDAAKAAVGWANINCGICHNENGAASANFRKHFLVRASDLASPDGGAAALEELDIWTQGYCVDTGRLDPTPDAGPYKYIRGGSPERSMMSILAGQRNPPDELPNAGVQMPPIVTRAVDHEGLALFNDWITSLAPCP